MAALHRAFLKAHNALRRAGPRQRASPEADLFDAARQALTWHYQWVVVEEFLPGLVGAELMRGPRHRHRDPAACPAGLTLPLRIRRRRLPLRPFPDPAELPARRPTDRTARSFPTSSAFARSRPTGPSTGALMFDGAPDDRRAARHAHQRALPFALIELPEALTGAVGDPATQSLANRDLQRGVRDRSALRRGRRARAGVDAALPRRDRPARLARRDPALVLHRARGRHARRRRPARPRGRAHRRRRALVAARPRPRLSYLAPARRPGIPSSRACPAGSACSTSCCSANPSPRRPSTAADQGRKPCPEPTRSPTKPSSFPRRLAGPRRRQAAGQLRWCCAASSR